MRPPRQMSNGESTFEPMPWGIDNVYVGESVLDAADHVRRSSRPIQDAEARLPECPYQPDM